MAIKYSTMDEIQKECEEIQSFLEITVSEEGAEIVDRGMYMAVYLARTSKLFTDAKYHLNAAKAAALILHGNKGWSPMIMRDAVAAEIRNEQALYDWVERLNKTCTHQLDWLRSVLSKIKEEMKSINFSG